MNENTVTILASSVRVGDRMTNISGPIIAIDPTVGGFVFITRFAAIERRHDENVTIRF